MLYPSTPSRISYQKESSVEPEQKFILPISVPKDTVMAIDVGLLTEEQVSSLASLHVQYQEYISSVLKAAFKFEDWIEHTTGAQLKLKWRSYKVDKISKVD